MATRGKPSVFAAFNQLRVSDAFDSDDGSAEEREQERKEKHKQKKKSRSKKKNSDSAQLKDLAFVSVSKPKKSKNKKNKAAQPSSPAAASPVEDVDDHVSEEKEAEGVEPKRTLAELMKATPTQKTAAAANGVEAKPQTTFQQQKKAPSKVQQPQAQQKQQQQQQPQSQQKQQQQSVAPKAAPVAAPSAPAIGPQSSSETELGAVYSPTHITITRVDGQMKRTVAVTEVMDQLLRYTQQNSQLLMVQEQLGHANRSLQDQLQRSAEIINGLQNEVTMFRQMCLNLQAEVSLLRSSAGPDAGGNHPRAPPGMS